MTTRAGVVSAANGALYLGVSVALAAAVTLGVLVAYEPNRTFTGLLLGLLCGVLAGAAMFARDTVEITDSGITTRTPWSHTRTAWGDRHPHAPRSCADGAAGDRGCGTALLVTQAFGP